jgi:hypothetical protein
MKTKSREKRIWFKRDAKALAGKEEVEAMKKILTEAGAVVEVL